MQQDQTSQMQAMLIAWAVHALAKCMREDGSSLVEDLKANALEFLTPFGRLLNSGWLPNGYPRGPLLFILSLVRPAEGGGWTWLERQREDQLPRLRPQRARYPLRGRLRRGNTLGKTNRLGGGTTEATGCTTNEAARCNPTGALRSHLKEGMMNAVAYHLEARSPFHFGVRGIGVEATGVLANADTLFAALCLSLRELKGTQRLTELLETFPTADRPDRQPPLLISSSFPYGRLSDSALVRFYPRPYSWPADIDRPSHPEQRKKFKKVAFVSEVLFHTWLKGEPLAGHFADENLLQGGEVWLTSEERAALEKTMSPEEELCLWKVEEAPRVTVDRASHASQVYQAGRVLFQAGGGLWFAVCWLDESWQPELEAVLPVLGDGGIGGERSAGHGQFVLREALSLNIPDSTGPLRVTLSPYHPTQAEVRTGVLAGSGVSYGLLNRRGWLGSSEGGGYRHRAVRMLAEGSVFRAQDGKSEGFGDLVDVTPKGFLAHPVYRFGLAFPIGVKGNE